MKFPFKKTALLFGSFLCLAPQINSFAEDLQYVRTMNYENGKVRGEVEYLRGFAHGKKKTYYPTGEVKNEESFKLGRLHGEFTRYYRNGAIRSFGNWDNGRPDGTVIINHPNGKPFLECEFHVGKQKTPCIAFNPQGEKSENEIKSYYADGTLAIHADFSEDELNGTVRYFTEKGTLQYAAPYVHGKIHGIVKSYDPDRGHLASESEFREGTNEGIVTGYRPNGKPQSRAEYKNWVLDGEVSYYDNVGELLGTYKYEGGYLTEHLYIRPDARREDAPPVKNQARQVPLPKVPA